MIRVILIILFLAYWYSIDDTYVSNEYKPTISNSNSVYTYTPTQFKDTSIFIDFGVIYNDIMAYVGKYLNTNNTCNLSTHTDLHLITNNKNKMVTLEHVKALQSKIADFDGKVEGYRNNLSDFFEDGNPMPNGIYDTMFMNGSSFNIDELDDVEYIRKEIKSDIDILTNNVWELSQKGYSNDIINEASKLKEDYINELVPLVEEYLSTKVVFALLKHGYNLDSLISFINGPKG